MTADTPELRPASDPLAISRARFAAFPDPLKQAMRIAARRHGWDEVAWAYQVGLLGDAMVSGTATAEELAIDYLKPPPRRTGILAENLDG